MAEYLSMLWLQGTFVTVGLPDEPLPTMNAMVFMGNAAKLGSSHIGSKKECLEMLDLVKRKNIKPWFVQFFPICCEVLRIQFMP